MITYIRGILEGMEEDKVIVDVGGVGYGIYMAGTAMGRLPALGKEVKIHTYLHVKEDLMQLYGFLNRNGQASGSWKRSKDPHLSACKGRSDAVIWLSYQG